MYNFDIFDNSYQSQVVPYVGGTLQSNFDKTANTAN
jgi:hypothetical protein